MTGLNSRSTGLSGGGSPIAAGSSGVTAAQPAGSPVVLANGATVDVTHEAITNEMVLVNVFIDSGQAGVTNAVWDFDTADEAAYTQQDATNGTDFVGDAIKLKNSGGGGGGSTQHPTAAMTSATAPAPYVAAHSTGNTGYEAWRCFNRSVADGTPWESTAAAPQWISLDMGSAKIVNEYRVTPWSHADYKPTAWVFEGSQNESAWTTLDTRSGITLSGTTEVTYTFSNSTAYRYYRFRVTAVAGPSTDRVQLYELKLFEPPDSYPTNTWYYVTTSDLSQFALQTPGAVVLDINSFTITQTTPASTSIRWLISFDDRVTWKKWNGSAWVAHAGGLGDIANGNTAAEIQTGLTNYTVQAADTHLDIAMGLHTTDAAASPTISGISFNYDEATRYDAATVGGYASSEQFGVRRLSPTTTRVKNLSGATQRCFINVVVIAED